jgi:hypothetical protein
MFSGMGDVTGQITGGQRSADGTKWEFIDQRGNVLTSMPLADFYSKYGKDGSGVGQGSSVSDINGVPLYYSAQAQEARRQEYLRANAPQGSAPSPVGGMLAPMGSTPSAPTNGVADPRGNNFLGGQVTRPQGPELAMGTPEMWGANPAQPKGWGAADVGPTGYAPGFSPKFNAQPQQRWNGYASSQWARRAPQRGMFSSGGQPDQQQIIQLLMKLFGGR